MAHWGVRARITAVSTLVVLVVLGAVAAALLASQRSLLTEHLDESLTSDGLAQVERYQRDGDPTLGRIGDDDAAAQLVDGRGRVLAATSNLTGRPPLVAVAPASARTVELFDGEPRYRLVGQEVGPLLAVTAAPLDDIDESVTALRRGLLIAIPLLVAVLGVVIWLIVGRTLRPVESIRREVADITGQRLDRRVPEPGGDDEIARLARTMNAMLARVEHAAERQRRFAADASHELRSPLTRMRSEIEVDLLHPDTADAAATRRSALEELDGLTRLVEDLALLARLDADAPQQATEPAALHTIAAEVAGGSVAMARVPVDLSGVHPATVQARPAELRRIVQNLLDNALRHAHRQVALEVRADESRAELVVLDDGAGVAAADRERIFERFTRLDEARQRATGGTGLGLAIARELTEQVGGTLTVGQHADGRTAFVATFPAVGRVGR